MRILAAPRPTAPVVEFISNGKDATHGAAQSEPPPLLPSSRECLCHCEMDRRCWLRRNPPHWLTLLFPFPLHITLSLQPSNHRKPMFLCSPHLNWFHYTYCIWPEWKLNIKLKYFVRTFAWSNEPMSRMFESLVASLSPNPLCSQSLKCYIHALMRDKMEIK